MTLCSVGFNLCIRPVSAQTYEWNALAKVKRIAVIAPFFCTETLQKKAADEKEHAYQKGLNLLAATMQKRIPVVLAASQQFQVVPQAAVMKALEALHWTPRSLFSNQGKYGTDWPEPNRERIATLAKRLKVDGIFLGTMREPATLGNSMQFHHETWNPNPLNWSLRRIHPHVVSPRVQAFLVTVKSFIAWKDEQMADRPRTKQVTQKTLLLDWQEATEQVAQGLADSLTRLPPTDSKLQ